MHLYDFVRSLGSWEKGMIWWVFMFSSIAIFWFTETRGKKKAVGKLPSRLKFYPPPKQALVVPYTRVILAYTPKWCSSFKSLIAHNTELHDTSSYLLFVSCSLSSFWFSLSFLFFSWLLDRIKVSFADSTYYWGFFFFQYSFSFFLLLILDLVLYYIFISGLVFFGMLTTWTLLSVRQVDLTRVGLGSFAEC